MRTKSSSVRSIVRDERIDEALGLLDPDRRFDACVLQSYFAPLPLRLIAFLRERTGALCVGGARLAGVEVDVDAVASDWRGAIDLAMERLRAAGHQAHRGRPGPARCRAAAGACDSTSRACAAAWAAARSRCLRSNWPAHRSPATA